MPIHRRLILAHLVAGVSTLALQNEAFGQNVVYSYDALGRIVTVTYPSGATITYTYDAAGNRTQVVQTASSGAPTGSFSASPTTIAQGASSTLSWTSSGATTASIDNGVGAVTPASGSAQVSPSVTTTYTLTLNGPGGQTTLQATVTVLPAPTGAFTANPTTIAQGASSTLSWTTSNATSASIDNGVGAVTPVAGGSVQVSPATTTTYTLTLAGPGGQATRQATVTVAPPPTGMFSANPTTIGQGASSTLSWTSANATSASIDNGVGAVSPVAGGSVQVSPATTTTYTLTLNGPGGQITRQAAVIVSGGAFNQTIQITGSGPVNLRALADAAGYNGAQNATITFVVGSGVTLLGGARCIDTGLWPSGSYQIALTLQISGKVYGGGGAGGTGGGYSSGTNGAAGGDALYCQENLTVVVNAGGELKSGGGGGGGGDAWRRTFSGETNYWNAGGGGGGFANGTLGSAGFADTMNASNGSAGTISSGGAGGAGGSAMGGRLNGGGGAGGGPGLPGQDGSVSSGSGGTGVWANSGFGFGGPAGYAVRKNGKTVGVTNNGTISGTVG